MSDHALDSSHLNMLTRRIEDMKERMIDPQEFGRLEKQVEQLTQQGTLQAAQLAEVQATLMAISATLSEARGGWRALMWAGGASAAAGSAITWLLQHLKHIP